MKDTLDWFVYSLKLYIWLGRPLVSGMMTSRIVTQPLWRHSHRPIANQLSGLVNENVGTIQVLDLTRSIFDENKNMKMNESS